MPESGTSRHSRLKKEARAKSNPAVYEQDDEHNNKGKPCPRLGCGAPIIGAFDNCCERCRKEDLQREIDNLGGTVLASGIKDGVKLQLNVLNASDVEMKKLEWLVPGMIPRSKVTLFSGKGESGKTTVAIDLAARVSTGADWPDGTKNEYGPMRVLMAVTEDDLDDTVVPNLVAAGADVGMVQFLRITSVDGNNVRMRKLQLKNDIVLVTNALKKHKEYALVILDPIFSFIGKANKNDDEEMRPIMEELQRVCGETKTAFVGIIHYNKKSDLDAVQGISGAGSIANVTRVIWAFSPDPDNKEEFYMSKAKGNILKRTQKGMKYRMTEAPVTMKNGEIDYKPKVEWLGQHENSADEVNKKVRDARYGKDTKGSKGVEVVKELLAKAPMRSPDVYAALTAAGVGERTQKDCCRDAGVHHNKRGGWWMSLPPNCPLPCKECGTSEKTMADDHRPDEVL
jgi:RecA-family ATPase